MVLKSNGGMILLVAVVSVIVVAIVCAIYSIHRNQKKMQRVTNNSVLKRSVHFPCLSLHFTKYLLCSSDDCPIGVEDFVEPLGARSCSFSPERVTRDVYLPQRHPQTRHSSTTSASYRGGRLNPSQSQHDANHYLATSLQSDDILRQSISYGASTNNVSC